MRGRKIAYNSDEMAWLAENKTLAIGDYHSGFVAQFARPDVSAINLHALRKRNGWKTGRSGKFAKGSTPPNKGKAFPVAALNPNCRKNQFRKGQTPHNTKFAGHERVSKDGYVEISINETNPHTGYGRRYVLKHRWLWEKANGPVPAGMALKCRGERINTDPSNWELVPRALLPRLNGGRHKKRIGYDEAPDELKPTIMAVAKLEQRKHELQTGGSRRPRKESTAP